MDLLPNILCMDLDDETELQGGTNLRMWNIIVGLEVFLFVTLLTKFAYDSWRYFRFGELPWMARKCM